MVDFKLVHFPNSVILYAVFFYVRYSVSYRDLQEIMAERGVEIDHATLNRWVIKYSPRCCHIDYSSMRLRYLMFMNVHAPTYKNHRFPISIVARAIWLYFRFNLSLREVEEMMLERGIEVSYETIRRWCRSHGSLLTSRLRRKSPSNRDVWHLDEVVVSIGGKNAGSGAQLIKMDMCLMRLFKPTATPRLPSVKSWLMWIIDHTRD